MPVNETDAPYHLHLPVDADGAYDFENGVDLLKKSNKNYYRSEILKIVSKYRYFSIDSADSQSSWNQP